MTISDFLTTGADLLRSAVCSHSGRSRGNVGGRHGFSARIAAAAIFALAATAILPANNAMAQQTGEGFANSSFTFSGADADVIQGSTVSFDAVLVYGQRSEPKFVGANVVITSDDGLDTEVNTVVNNMTTRTIVTNEFTISLNASTDSRIFLVTDRSNNGGRSGSFRIMFPDTTYRLTSTATARVDITPRTDAERSVDENRDAVRIGAATFTAGDAFRLDEDFTGGVPGPREDTAMFRVRANVNPSSVTYTIVETTATLAATSSTNIPAVADTEREFSVTLANVPSTVSVSNVDTDVERVRLILEFGGGDLAFLTPFGTTSDACVSGTPCGWQSGDYMLEVDIGTTPSPRLTDSGSGKIFLDVPFENLTDGGGSVDFTLSVVSGRTPATGSLTVELEQFGLRDNSGANLREIFNDGTNPERQQTLTYTVINDPDDDNARLDDSLVFIGGVPIILAEAGPTDSTGTVTIPGSLTADSRNAEVSVATLNDDATVTGIDVNRDTAPTGPETAPTEIASGAFTQRLTGLVPGTYIVTINTEAVDETERSYDITLNVSGVGISRPNAVDLLESSATGVDTNSFTISLAGIDTSDDVTGVRMSLQFPAGRGGFVVDGGNPLLWRSDLFELTFPDTVGTISAANDIITFVASTSGTSEVDIDIRAIFGMPELRGVHTISIVDPAALTGDRNVFRVNASNVSQGSVIARPSAVEFTVAQGTSPVVEILPTDLVAREGDSANKGTLTINLANIADTGTDVVIPYALVANSNSDLTADLGIGEDYTVELVGATFTTADNTTGAVAGGDSITVAHEDIDNNTRRASFTFAVTALEDDEVEDEGRETVILTLGPANTITPVGIGLDPTNGTRTIAIADNDFADVCFRNAAVQTAILGALTSIDDCAVVDAEDLQGIGDGFTAEQSGGTLLIASAGGNLNAGDLDDLTNVKTLDLRNNSLTNFSTDLFRDMANLERILAHGGNDLGRLVVGTFNGLDSIERLTLTSNDNRSFADNALDDILDTLQVLNINDTNVDFRRYPNFDGDATVVQGATTTIPVELRTEDAGTDDGSLPAAVMVPVTITTGDDTDPTLSGSVSVEVDGSTVTLETAGGVVIPAGAERADLTITATTAAALDDRTITIGTPQAGVIEMVSGNVAFTPATNAAVSARLVLAGSSPDTATVMVAPATTLGALSLTPIPSGNAAVALAPTFEAGSTTTEYSVTYHNGTTGITVVAEPTNDEAFIVDLTGLNPDTTTPLTGDGTNDPFTGSTATGERTVTFDDLAVGANVIEIVVGVDNDGTTEMETHTITVNVEPVRPTMVTGFTVSNHTIGENSGTSTVTLTLNVAVPAGESLNFPYTISGTGITADDITNNMAFDADDGFATAGSLTGNITVAAGSSTGSHTIIARSNLVTDLNSIEGNETMTVTLGTLPDNGAPTPVALMAADGVDLDPLNIMIVEPTFTFINQRVPRMEIGGDPGEITLRIENYLFPEIATPLSFFPEGAASDVLAVGLSIGAGTDHSGNSVNHGFALRGADEDLIITNGAQVVRGFDLSARLTNPRNLGANKPYLISQNSSTFRVILPKTLFELGAGTDRAENAEEVTFQIVPGGRKGARPQDFTWQSGSGFNARVYESITAGRRDDPVGGAFVSDPANNSVHFTIARASDAAQLPRMMNPEEQEVMRDATVGVPVIVDLPPGIDAPADAAMAVIKVDVTADNAGVSFPNTSLSINSTSGFAVIEVDGETVNRSFIVEAPAPRVVDGETSIRDEESVTVACTAPNINDVRACTTDSLDLRVTVTPGRPLSGNIAFNVAPGSVLETMDAVTFEAMTISFLDSAGAAIADSTTTLIDAIIANRTAKVTALTTVSSAALLSELTVGGETLRVGRNDSNTFLGNIVPLSIAGATTGEGSVSIGFVGTADDVPVGIDLAVGTDMSEITGVNELNQDLTGTGLETLVMGDRTVSVAASGDPAVVTAAVMMRNFTPGMNTLTVKVRPTGETDATNERTYTIRVFVPDAPPAAGDSSLRRVTVDDRVVMTSGGLIFGGANRSGAITIPNADTTAIVVAPTNINARVTVCTAADNVSRGTGIGVVPVGAAPVGSASAADTATEFRILVAAESDPASNPAAELPCGRTGPGVTAYLLTVTVEAIPNDATPDTLTLDGVDLPIITGTGNNVSVALPAGTVGGELVITAVAGATVTSTNGVAVGDPANTATVTLAGIVNDDTITFTIVSARGGSPVQYTLTFIVQNASLASGTTFRDLPITLQDTEGALTGSGTVSIGANISSGMLALVLADTDDAIYGDVTGVTEAGGRLAVSQVGTTNNYTVGGLLTPGTSTLTVVVRPNGGDGTTDRTYEIDVLVANPSTTRTAGIVAIGRAQVSPTAMGATPNPTTGSAKFNVVLSGFNTTGLSGTVESARMTLKFPATGGNFSTPAVDSDTGEFTTFNTEFDVILPATVRMDNFGVDALGGASFDVDPGEIQFRTALAVEDDSFVDDGIIYMPITITPKETASGDTFTVSLTSSGTSSNDVDGLNGDVIVESVATADPRAIMYTVLDATRSSARVSPAEDDINSGDSTQIQVNVDPGFGTLESSGYAQVDFTVDGGTADGRTVIVTAPGETLTNTTNVPLSMIDFGTGGGSFRIADGQGDAIITVMPHVISTGDETVTLTLTGLSYETPPAGENLIDTPEEFADADVTVAEINVFARSASTLATLSVDIGGETNPVVGADGGNALLDGGLNVFVGSGDATADLTVTTTEGATVLVCAPGSIDLDTGKYPVPLTAGETTVTKVHVTSASRGSVNPALHTCDTAARDADTTTTYTYNIAAAPVPTGTINAAIPANLVENGGREGTFTVELTDILGVFDDDSSPATPRVDFTNFWVNLALSVTGTGADTGFTPLAGLRTTVETDDFSLEAGGDAMFNTRSTPAQFSLRVPHSAFTFDDNGFGDASVEITITTKDVTTDANLPYTMDFTVISAIYRADLNSIGDFVEGTNTAPIFTIIAGDVPSATLRRVDDDQNISESITEGTGKDYTITLANLPPPSDITDTTDVYLSIPFEIVTTDATYDTNPTDITDGGDFSLTAAVGTISGFTTGDGLATPYTGTLELTSAQAVGALTLDSANNIYSGALTVTIDPTPDGLPGETDAVVDADETVTLTLDDDGTPAPVPSTLVLNNDGNNDDLTTKIVERATVSITPPTTTATEGDEDGTNLTVRIGRGPIDSTVPATVTFTVEVGGTGTTRASASDYVITSPDTGTSLNLVAGTFVIANGATVGTLNVEARDDGVIDPGETVTITVTQVQFSGVGTEDDHLESITAGPGFISVVTLINTDAGTALVTSGTADSIAEQTPNAGMTTFGVSVTSVAMPFTEVEITLTLGGNAIYGAATGGTSPTVHDYKIESSDATITARPTDGAAGGTLTATFTPTSADDSVTFTVTAYDDEESGGSVNGETDSIIVELTSVTNDGGNNTLTPVGATTHTINIADNDRLVTSFCDRTDEVEAAILLLIPSSPACGAVLAVHLERITTLTVSGLTGLKSGDFAGLTALTSLMLDGALTGSAVPNGVFDDVLGNGVLATLMVPPSIQSEVSVENSDNGRTIMNNVGTIPRGESRSFTITRTNPHTAITVSYTLAYEAGNFTVPDPLSVTFDVGEARKTVPIMAGSGAALTGRVVIMLDTPTLPADTREPPITALATALISVPTDTDDRTFEVVLPTAQPTLSLTEGSIGEKSQDELVVTLDLDIGNGTGYGGATVTFTLSNPAGDETMDPGVPTLVSGTDDNPVDYTLMVGPVSQRPDFAANTTTYTVAVLEGTSAVTFTFKAIDDDRREGNEDLTLMVTRVVFGVGADATPFIGSLAANVTITEISGEDVMRETQMIAHAVGKEQVNLITGLVRQRVSALTLGTPEGFSEPGVQLALAENPETMEDFFSQMALESSGEMDEGGAYAIWAKGQYIKISGSPDVTGMSNFEYDGKIAGIGMGMEKRFSESLVGLSMNFSTADIDSSSDVRTNANYKETMTFFAPYAAWKPDNSRLTLWGTAGAGFGSATVNADEHAEGNPSVQAFFAQGGVDISENIGRTAEFVFGMSAVAIEKTVDAWTAGTDSAPEAESSIFQAQADATAYFPVYSDDGQVLRPYVGLASVHDIGDVTNDDRHAMELQTGITWSNGPWQVSFDTFYQFLRDDEEAWGVFGEAQWSGTGDLDGLLMGMTSGHGTASSMSDAASSTDSVNSDIDTNLANADTETAEWSVQTNSEYGFAAPVVDRNGRATPFFRSTHSADAQSFVSGVRMDVTDNIGVTAESNRHIPADDDPYSEHAVGLEARWEF